MRRQTDACAVSEQQVLGKDCPPVSLLSTMLGGMEHPVGQTRSAVSAVRPAGLVATPCLLAAWAEGETGRPAVAKTLLCYQRCYSHCHKTQHHAGCSEEN